MIYLSCGHIVDTFMEAHDVIVKSIDREGNRALSYEMVCEECFQNYKKRKECFVNEKVAFEWLSK